MCKKYSYLLIGAFLGLIVGFVLGALIGLGEANQYKKSQRDTATPILIGGFGVCGAIAGAVIGHKVGNEVYIEEKSGFNSATTGYGKDGRYWFGMTEWIDPRNNNTYQIVTERVAKGIIETRINEIAVMRHDTNSASRHSIERCHNEGKRYVLSAIKDAFYSDPTLAPTELF